MALFPIGLLVSIGFGDMYAARASTVLLTAYYVTFFLLYAVLITWIAIYLARKLRKSAASRQA